MVMHAGPSGRATSVAAAAFPLTPTAGTDIVSVNGIKLVDVASGVLAQKNAATAQALRVYGTETGPKYVVLQHDGSNAYLTTGAGSGNLYIGNASDYLACQTHLIGGTDGTFDIGITGSNRFRSLFLAGPSITSGSGTGLTVNDSGSVRRQTHKVTVTFAALAAAATTADKTIATLPAKCRLTAFYADTTTKYIGGAVSACTIKVGAAVNGGEVLASHDVFTAAVTKGLADADMGTAMTRAAAIQGGYMPSFTGTTIISVRLTTTSANTNALTQGSTTYYLETETLP